MKKICLAVGVLAFLTSAFCAENMTIQTIMSKFLEEKKYDGSGIGIVIKNLDSDSCLVKINENEMLNPASVSKLVTGAAALDLLGTNFNFETSVFFGRPFNMDSGIVKGNLYIRGGGDPGFTAERLWLLVQHLYHHGIRRIDGDLVIDDSFFDTVNTGPGFSEDSTSRAYQPLISALSVSFNTLAVNVRPGNSANLPLHVDIFPVVKDVSVEVRALTAAAGKKCEPDIQTVSSGGRTRVIVSGSMPLDAAPKYYYRKIWQTWEMVGGAIASQFAECNIKLCGRVISGLTPDSLLKQQPFYTFESEPLSIYIGHMFKYSSNFAAEMIFRSIPSVLDTVRGSWPLGAQRVLSWWNKSSLPGTPVIKNGSGMGNSNRMSAYQITSLLSHVWKQKKYLPEYLNALSVSGVDGTIKSRFRSSELKGLVRAKTGTLNAYRTSTLAGYLLLPKGNFAFAIFCNGVGGGQYDNWVVQEQILEKFNKSIR